MAKSLHSSRNEKYERIAFQAKIDILDLYQHRVLVYPYWVIEYGIEIINCKDATYNMWGIIKFTRDSLFHFPLLKFL